MIQLEIYAAGLREGERVLQLDHQLEAYSGLTYKVDTNHDLVYFEIEHPPSISLGELKGIFTLIGLDGRVVGAVPSELADGGRTQRIA